MMFPYPRYSGSVRDDLYNAALRGVEEKVFLSFCEAYYTVSVRSVRDLIRSFVASPRFQYMRFHRIYSDFPGDYILFFGSASNHCFHNTLVRYVFDTLVQLGFPASVPENLDRREGADVVSVPNYFEIETGLKKDNRALERRIIDLHVPGTYHYVIVPNQSLKPRYTLLPKTRVLTVKEFGKFFSALASSGFAAFPNRKVGSKPERC